VVAPPENPPTHPQVVVTTPQIVVAENHPSPVAVAVAATPVKPVTANAVKPSDHGHPSKGAKETLPADVAADLDDAEKKLGSDPAETIRVARRTQQTVDSERSHSLVARGYCKQHDLGNAKAALLSPKLSGAERGRIKRACKADGVDID
jgi:hypothetical protein